MIFSAPSYEYIKTQTVGAKNNVGVITLNRPKALNALCKGLMTEVAQALDQFETDRNIGAIIITGSEKAFAAGADIKEMLNNTYANCVRDNFLSDWNRVSQTSKPVIAAVNGYAVSVLFFFLQQPILSLTGFCCLNCHRSLLNRNQQSTKSDLHSHNFFK